MKNKLTVFFVAIFAIALGALILRVPVRGAHAQDKSTPLPSAGSPARMMYDFGDPTTLGYPCDASHMGMPFYNLNAGISRPIWLCNSTSWVQAQPTITGVTGTIAGGVILFATPSTTRISVPGVTPGMNCIATRADGAFSPVGLNVDPVVQIAGSVDVRLSTPLATVTSTSSIYNIRCFQ